MAESNSTERTLNTRDMDRENLHDHIKRIRYALHVGLASYGEIEKVLNWVETLKATNQPVPEGLVPVHPTGSSQTVGDFAEALLLLDILEDAPLTV